MAPADRLTGTAVVVEFLPTGGTIGVDEIPLEADYTSFQWNRQVDTVDLTAGSETARYEKSTIESMDWSLMMFDAKQTYLDSLQPGATGTLYIYKVGNTSGNPVIEFPTLLTGYSEDHPFDGALEIDISGVRTGDMVRDVGSVVP
jgi:hypothetical protein